MLFDARYAATWAGRRKNWVNGGFGGAPWTPGEIDRFTYCNWNIAGKGPAWDPPGIRDSEIAIRASRSLSSVRDRQGYFAPCVWFNWATVPCCWIGGRISGPGGGT